MTHLAVDIGERNVQNRPQALAEAADCIEARFSATGLATERPPGSQKYPPPLGLLYPSAGDFVAFVGNLASRDIVRRAVATFRKVESSRPKEALPYDPDPAGCGRQIPLRRHPEVLLSAETLQDIRRSLVAAGQVEVVSVGGRIVFRARG